MVLWQVIVQMTRGLPFRVGQWQGSGQIAEILWCVTKGREGLRMASSKVVPDLVLLSK